MSGRVFLGAGHMVDAPGRAAPRFPAVKEEAVRSRMARQLEAWSVGAGDLALCGGARGADLIFAELCHDRGARVVLLLPEEPASFAERSVHLPGSDWKRRFALFEALKPEQRGEIRVQLRELGTVPAGESRYTRNNAWLLETAAREAGGAEKLFVLLVWDQERSGDGPGGTADLARAVADLPPAQIAIVDPQEVAAFDRDLHWARDGEPKRILTLDGGGVRGVLTLQYLKRLEEILRAQHDRPELRLRDYFDLIAGTSTGAIIAAALALGMGAGDIEKRYESLATQVFRRRRTRQGALRAKFDAKALEAALQDLFVDRTLGSSELETGLLIVTKRYDSGSQWPLSNYPRAKYFHSRAGRGTTPNGEYALWRVVRASTAAPHYFAPAEIEVHPGERKQFIDGGASTANNPTLEALKLVTLRGFGVGWPTGADRLLIVSCGTGRADPRNRPSAIAAKHALSSLTSIMNDCADLIETIMQWISESPTPWFVDSDIGDLSGDLLGTEPLCTYLRYNVDLSAEWLQAELGERLPDALLEQLQEMDQPANMRTLARLGRLSAEKHLHEAHIPARFKVG